LNSFIDLNDKIVFADKKWDKEHEHRLAFLKVFYLFNFSLILIRKN